MINGNSKIIVKRNLPTTKVSAPAVTVKYQKSGYFYVKVLKTNGKAIKNLKRTVKFSSGKKSKMYLIKTNKKGLLN